MHPRCPSGDWLRGWLFCGLLVAVVGCKSISQYVSPQVEGRVLDARSRQPIKGVRVARLSSQDQAAAMQPPKAGQAMLPSDSVQTAADGQFRLPSLKDLGIFRKLNWYSVTVSFEHSFYLPETTTYTISSVTNSASGVPTLKLGDVLLAPKKQ
jgi:hypothetical protein